MDRHENGCLAQWQRASVTRAQHHLLAEFEIFASTGIQRVQTERSRRRTFELGAIAQEWLTMRRCLTTLDLSPEEHLRPHGGSSPRGRVWSLIRFCRTCA
jgi:hypothetical protein